MNNKKIEIVICLIFSLSISANPPTAQQNEKREELIVSSLLQYGPVFAGLCVAGLLEEGPQKYQSRGASLVILMLTGVYAISSTFLF